MENRGLSKRVPQWLAILDFRSSQLNGKFKCESVECLS